MKTILLQGDSITDAGRSREYDLPMGYGYPTLLNGRIGHDYPGQYKVLNRGISGNRIVDLYARIKSDIINLKPDIMSILIGVNDVWHEFSKKNGVAPEKYYKIYDMLIEEVKEALPDTKMIILEPFVLNGAATKEHWEDFSNEVRKLAEKSRLLAQKHDLPFIELQDKFTEAAKLVSDEYWLSDGVHPTTAGHELIAREWMKVFREIEDLD
ncbi:MAG: SGNH/GDSL hydrolase family protein [Clostridia bacterium]|nr:SGNH/GDSL hydrolase family protein [Clostridia bacterium]